MPFISVEPMHTLIIPDIHNHTDHADHWLATQRYDRVIFLGDYFDDFGDDVNDARRTAMWLRDRMEKFDDIFLLGNHDVAYMFPRDPQLFCPRRKRGNRRNSAARALAAASARPC